MYLTSKKSYREIANQIGVAKRALLTHLGLDYREKGKFSFSNARGRPRKEPKMLIKDYQKKLLIWKKLNKNWANYNINNLKLRIENEYLKGLRSLRLEQQARKNQDLFSASKENSSSHANKS